jgi:hypothetical protein
MQVGSGNPFQYQYQLSLNGKSDTIEDLAEHGGLRRVLSSPLFHDSAGSSSSLSPTPGSLARVVPAATSFNGQPDWFVDFAFPVSTLVEGAADRERR